jgi:hypothetical protein
MTEKLQTVLDEKVYKFARQLTDRYSFVVKAYESLVAAIEEAATLLPGDPSGLTRAHVLALADREIFRIGGSRLIDDPSHHSRIGANRQIRTPRAPGAINAAVSPEEQMDLTLIPPLVVAITTLITKAANPPPAPRLAPITPAATPTLPKVGEAHQRAPQGISMAEAMIIHRQQIEEQNRGRA